MKNNRSFAIGLTVLGMLGFIVAGCKSGTGNDGYLSKEEMTKEYRTEAKKWELAPGWTWPMAPYSGKGPDGRPAVYEQSSAQNDASFYWFCSWGSAWLEAKSPSERVAAASRLTIVPKSPFYMHLLPRDRKFFDEEVLRPIANGEDTRPRQVIMANCQKDAWT